MVSTFKNELQIETRCTNCADLLDLLNKVDKMNIPFFQKHKNIIVFTTGLIIYFVLNLLTAATLEVHFDEAYYWLYAQNLAWGYFDHPPMVAWLIAAGQYFFNGTLGLRIFTVLASTITMCLLWQMVKKFKPNALLFWAVIYSVILIHPYTFIATPDGPLILFTTLFLLAYRQFTKFDTYLNTFVLASCMAFLLYTKYHGVLVIIFVLISNLKLLRLRNFWISLLLAIVLYVPHIFWQINNHFPSINYHLLESHKTGFSVAVTLNYLGSELLLAGGFLGWLFLFALWKTNVDDIWEKGLRYVGIGTFGFFFVASFAGDFEAHWTMVAAVPLILLSYKYITFNMRWQKWVYIFSLFNFFVLVAVRLLLISPFGQKTDAFKTIVGWEKASLELKDQVSGYPIAFQDNWIDAARFAYYTNNHTVSSLNSALHRKNQFDLTNFEEQNLGKTVYVLSNDADQFSQCDTLNTSNKKWYGKKIENFRSYYGLNFLLDYYDIKNNQLVATVSLKNTYDQPLYFDANSSQKACFQLVYRERNKWNVFSETGPILITTEPHSIQIIDFEINIPNNKIDNDLFLVLKIGELNPIPVKYEIQLN